MNPVKIKIGVLLWILIISISFGNLSAEVLGPLLPKSTGEIGMQFRWIHRDLGELGSTFELDQYDASLPIRVGITEYVTLTTELLVGNEDVHSEEMDLRYYLLGFGAQALFWRNEDYIVSGSINSMEIYLRKTDGSSCNQTQWGITGIIQVQRTFPRKNYDITIWGGPLYAQYKVIRKASNTCSEASWGTSNILGAGLGVNFLLFGHYQLYYNFIYVDYYQPRIGVSYRF